MNKSFVQFQNQSFINLETFRKNGIGVKTPVWFVEDEGRFYVRTGAESWKVKRIHNNPQIKVVPSKSQGQPIGKWVPAVAHRIDNPVREVEINKLFNRKYGLQKRFFDLMGMMRKDQLATLEIELSGEQRSSKWVMCSYL
jgi:PPOX class probable F420-dependent enzyme